MHPLLIMLLFALATGLLLALGLVIESWMWQRGIKPLVPGWAGIWDRVLSIILVLIILGTLGTLGYFVANPKDKSFTEFYILGSDGKATDYPRELAVGEEGKVIVGIINYEYQPVSYRVEAVISGVKDNEVVPVTLQHGEKWQGTVGFTPDRAGDSQKVEFLLYRQGQTEVYQRLYLLVDVK